MKLKLLITSCAFVFLYVGNVDAGIKKLKARVSGGDDRQQVQVQPLPPQPAPLEADHHPRGEALPHEGGDLPPPQDGGIPQAPPLGGGDEEHLALPLVQPQPLAELLRDNIMVNHYLHPEAPAEDAGEVHNEDLGGDEEEEQGEEQEEGAGNAELHPHDPLHVPAEEPPADNPPQVDPAVAPPPAENQQQPGQPGVGGDVPPPPPSPLVDNVPNLLQGEGAPGVQQPAPHPADEPAEEEDAPVQAGQPQQDNPPQVNPVAPPAQDGENAGLGDVDVPHQEEDAGGGGGEEVVDDANPDAQPDVHAPRQPRRGGVEGGEDEQEMDIGNLFDL